jgi:carboxylate-amine ligase
MTAFRGLRHRLALLRALATGSPYWQGRDSGLASARWAVIKGYPRGGVPPVIAGWDEYVERAGDVAAAAEAPDHSHVWWDLRARPRLGTLEVRVMDAQPSLDLAAGLAAPVQGLARHPVERPPASDLSSEVLAENDFRAAMYGLNTSIVDRDGTLRPAPALLRKQWRQHEPRLPLTAWPNRWMPSSGCSGPSRSTNANAGSAGTYQ